MNLTTTTKLSELTAPTAELRALISQMRREMDILRRREQIREREAASLKVQIEQAARVQNQLQRAALPQVKGAAIDAYCHPADGITGDFHYVRRISKDAIAILVADATGHGVGAALISSLMIGSLRTLAVQHEDYLVDPSRVLCCLNSSLTDCQLVDCEFVTAVYAVYWERTQSVKIARAGAPPPVLRGSSGGVKRIASPGLPLGVECNAEFSTLDVDLQRGDEVLFHTDGLEALCASHAHRRSESEFLDWLSLHGPQGVHKAAASLLGSGAQRRAADDDLTLLTLRITG